MSTPANSQTGPSRIGARRDPNPQLFSSVKTRLDLITNPGQPTSIKTVSSARNFLASKGLVLTSAAPTIDSLSSALLEFTNTAPNLTALHYDTLRAIAILMEDSCVERSTASIIQALAKHVEGPLALLEQKATELEEAANRNTTTAETLTRVAEEVSSQLDNSTEMLESAIATAITHVDASSKLKSNE
ncbi:hypothetical protein BV22DRAFT_981595, partial [Leucogyrophana mollusca]